jgi:hypothetical protein
MSDQITHPPIVVELPTLPVGKWEREYRAFLRLLPDLLHSHRGKYAAVHMEQAVDFDDDELALASRVWAQHGYVPIHIGLVTDSALPPARIPHRRELRSAQS